MLKTAITIKEKDGSPVMIPCAGRMSGRYNYLSRTLVIEDSENAGFIYDFILKDDVDKRIEINANGDMARILNCIDAINKINDIDCPVKLVKDNDNYQMTGIFVATPGISLYDGLIFQMFPDWNSNYVCEIRDFLRDSNKGTSRMYDVIRKKCSPDRKVYDFTERLFGNLLNIKTEDILLISADDTEETLFKNLLKADEKDIKLTIGLYQTIFGLYCNDGWATSFIKNERDDPRDPFMKLRKECVALFVNEYVQHDPMKYSKLSRGLNIICHHLMSNIDADDEED